MREVGLKCIGEYRLDKLLSMVRPTDLIIGMVNEIGFVSDSSSLGNLENTDRLANHDLACDRL